MQKTGSKLGDFDNPNTAPPLSTSRSMFARIALHAATLLLFVGITASVGQGAITYDFNEGKLNLHDGEGTSNSLSDTATFTDNGDLVTLTTTTVLGSDGTDNENTFTEEVGGLFGINTPLEPTTTNAFNGGETWAFNWSHETFDDTILTSVSFQSPDSAVFSIKNAAWASRTFDDSTVSGLSYVGAGEFHFNLNTATVYNDLTNVGNLRVPDGTDYTFTAVSGTVSLDSFTFATATAVPEPGSAVALLGIAGLAVGRRFHRKRKRAVASVEA